MDREQRKELLIREEELAEELKSLREKLGQFYKLGAKFLHDLNTKPENIILSNSSLSYSMSKTFSGERLDYDLNQLRQAFDVDKMVELLKVFNERHDEYYKVKRELGK